MPKARGANRCTAMRRTAARGMRCTRPIVEGTDRCDIHQHGTERSLNGGAWNLPRFYKAVLGPTLTEAIEAIEAAPAEEQLSVREELALMRDVAAQGVYQYGKARELLAVAESAENVDDKTLDDARQLVLSTGTVMSSMAKEVIGAARVAVDVERQGDQVSLRTVGIVVDQILTGIYSVFGDDYRVPQIVEYVRANVRVPQAAVRGTDITPDMSADADALAMDATI